MADEAKAKGNAAFSSGDFTAAVTHFTDAINLAPTNHVLFSNRSAAHASLHHYEEALSDAKKTVELKPDWAKGYSRLGAAHIGLNQYDEAVEAYTKGLEIDPNNEALKSGLADASRSRAAPPNPFGDAFKGPEMWAKLTADPSTRAFLKQPDFVNMMQEIQRNPSNLNLYLKDQRVMQSLGVLLNVQFRTQAGDEAEAMEDEMVVNEPKVVEKKREPEPEPEPEPEVGEEKEKKERKEKALKEKEMGNAAYKKKDFDTAIKHYSTAMEIDDEDISFITNRAAVYLEMGKYDECIKDCDKAVERGRELRSDYKMIAKALTRKGTALGKMAKVSKDYEPVIETYQKALTEHRNPDTLKRLNEAERAKKELEQQEYFDPTIGDAEREKGNEFFKEQKYPDAVKHYTEAIKRNPKDPRAYSNRAACYTKLGAMPEGLKDAEKCIELDPTFSKGYSRKGAVQFFMKEYDNAMETYQEGLKHDPNKHELLDGVKRCVQQINKANRGDLTPEELKERQAKGMQDPEIQNILTDPVMRQVHVDSNRTRRGFDQKEVGQALIVDSRKIREEGDQGKEATEEHTLVKTDDHGFQGAQEVKEEVKEINHISETVINTISENLARALTDLSRESSLPKESRGCLDVIPERVQVQADVNVTEKLKDESKLKPLPKSQEPVKEFAGTSKEYPVEAAKREEAKVHQVDNFWTRLWGKKS